MNSNENIHKRNVHPLPTIQQLRAICECYGLTPNKNATLHNLLCLLDDVNVKMEFSLYDGPQVELQAAIIHWMDDPKALSTTELDSSDSSNDFCRFECVDSDDEMDDAPTDAKVVNAVDMHELYHAPSDSDVQQEVEVEADEC